MALARFSSFLPSSRKTSFKSASKQQNHDPRKIESMTSGLDSEEQARSPGIDHLADLLEDKTTREKGSEETRRNTQEIPPDKAKNIEPSFKLPKRPKRKITKPGELAYVAPIPKIGSIPPIPPISPSSGIPISASSDRPKLPPFVGSFLLGKKVDEYGDIVDDKTGQVLARAGGDLPSIVGREVSNRQGDILGDNGELLGYVADIEIERKGSGSGTASGSGSPGLPQPRSLLEIMSRSNASLMVDHLGNILDTEGNVVGKFHDNNNPLHRKNKEEREKEESEKKPVPPPKEQRAGDDDTQGEENNKQKQKEPEEQPEEPEQEPESSQSRRPRRTEEERRANAQAWRKENPGESPSDIFLDVKSTTEGIQLTIRIPTVFGGQQVRPNISFS